MVLVLSVLLACVVGGQRPAATVETPVVLLPELPWNMTLKLQNCLNCGSWVHVAAVPLSGIAVDEPHCDLTPTMPGMELLSADFSTYEFSWRVHVEASLEAFLLCVAVGNSTHFDTWTVVDAEGTTKSSLVISLAVSPPSSELGSVQALFDPLLLTLQLSWEVLSSPAARWYNVSALVQDLQVPSSPWIWIDLTEAVLSRSLTFNATAVNILLLDGDFPLESSISRLQIFGCQGNCSQPESPFQPSLPQTYNVSALTVPASAPGVPTCTLTFPSSSVARFEAASESMGAAAAQYYTFTWQESGAEEPLGSVVVTGNSAVVDVPLPELDTEYSLFVIASNQYGNSSACTAEVPAAPTPFDGQMQLSGSTVTVTVPQYDFSLQPPISCIDGDTQNVIGILDEDAQVCSADTSTVSRMMLMVSNSRGQFSLDLNIPKGLLVAGSANVMTVGFPQVAEPLLISTPDLKSGWMWKLSVSSSSLPVHGTSMGVGIQSLSNSSIAELPPVESFATLGGCLVFMMQGPEVITNTSWTDTMSRLSIAADPAKPPSSKVLMWWDVREQSFVPVSEVCAPPNLGLTSATQSICAPGIYIVASPSSPAPNRGGENDIFSSAIILLLIVAAVVVLVIAAALLVRWWRRRQQRRRAGGIYFQGMQMEFSDEESDDRL